MKKTARSPNPRHAFMNMKPNSWKPCNLFLAKMGEPAVSAVGLWRWGEGQEAVELARMGAGAREHGTGKERKKGTGDMDERVRWLLPFLLATARSAERAC